MSSSAAVASDSPAHWAEAVRRGYNVMAWDFLFYASFAVVVTSSVAVAGVLLVFSLLVIPPVVALLLTVRSGRRLVLGWGTGLLGAIVGITGSVGLDLPAGPTIMCALVALLVLTSIFAPLKRRCGEESNGRNIT